MTPPPTNQKNSHELVTCPPSTLKVTIRASEHCLPGLLAYPCTKHGIFLHHNPVSAERLDCSQMSGPKFGSVPTANPPKEANMATLALLVKPSLCSQLPLNPLPQPRPKSGRKSAAPGKQAENLLPAETVTLDSARASHLTEYRPGE